jgi:glycosyltransferase involved in cell wall biosynthesis
MQSRPHRFVCVHNRNRDGYEVPLALEEAGLLDTFVTDFYAAPRWHRFLPTVLARRFKPGLPAKRTLSVMASFALQYTAQALRLPMQGVFVVNARILGRASVKRARQNAAHLYAYATYLPEKPDLAPGAKIIDFEYHPHPALSIEILRQDYARFPQVSWSMAMEERAHAGDTGSTAWRDADAVVCASAMTRRALEHAGCPPERITVIPYGIPPVETPAPARPSGPCQFLYVGQGLSRKGLHHLAAAWEKARPHNAELTIVAYRIDPGIAKMVNQPGIRFLGRQSRADLDAIFARADVFIMPSLVEGFGLVYLEALQAGCHVVGTPNTGLPDLHLSNDAATIVPVGDIDAIAHTITTLAARKSAQGFDPVAIQAEGNRWTWPDFRAAIVAHARQIIA